MLGRISFFCAIGILFFSHVFLYELTFDRKQFLDDQVRVQYVLPVEFSRVAALDFQGLAADFQLLQGVFFVGEKIERQEQVDVADWDYFTRIIRAVIRLDPYFYDTYHLATGMLTWGAGRYQDAVDILQVAREYNPDDFRFPFHLGFIHFYFLNDAQKGAQYLELASRFPGAPPLFATLAARLAYYKGNYQFSIELLQRVMAEERSLEIRAYYEKRLKALEGALGIETAIRRYREAKSVMPDSLSDLLLEGYLSELPDEPYGGDWVMLENGRVYSTSKFAEKPGRVDE